jgi:hypothetical protein
VTVAGDQVVAAAYSWVGTTENPPNSNLCSPFTDAWGPGAWCAMAVSYWCQQGGAPLPAINGPAGFSYVPDGQVAAFHNGRSVGEGGAEPGDVLHFSWEPWFYGADGVAYCSYGVYAGAPAGDHTGLFVGWAGDGYMVTVEGNTSQSSWDNGGAVMERGDRHVSQICCYARHAALEGPPTTPEDEMTEQDFDRIRSIVHDEVLNVWRAQEMANLDTERAQRGAHEAGVGLMRSDEFAAILQTNTGGG